MKKCNEVRELISLYIDGLMDDVSKVEFEEHIGHCEECRQELEEIATTIELCRDIEEVKLPVDFKQQLHEKLISVNSEQKAFIKFTSKYRRFIRLCASAAAVFIVAFAVRGLFGNFTILQRTKSDEAAPENLTMAESTFRRIANEDNKSVDESLITTSGVQDAIDSRVIETIAGSGDINIETEASPFQTAMFSMAVPSNMADIEILVSELEVEIEKLENCLSMNRDSFLTMDKGADLKEELNGAPVRYKTTDSYIIADYKVLNSKYRKFMDCLNENFPTLTVVRNVDLDSVDKKITEIELEIIDIDKKIVDLTDNEMIKQLKDMREQKITELERLRQEYEYIIVSIRLVKDEATEPGDSKE